MVNNTAIQVAANLILSSKQLTIFTGAGVSKESGIPTYRDPREGLWEKYDPMELATPFGYINNPQVAWKWHLEGRTRMLNAQPNPGHFALTELERRYSAVIITQNVDDLHERAGSKSVVHLHGSILTHRCFQNCRGNPTLIDISKLSYDLDSGPPRCPYCSAYVRPNVVWFGEVLPREPVQDMFDALNETDLMLVVGLSGAITYNVPQMVKQRGGRIIEVNPNESEITPHVDVFLQGFSGEVLPELVTALGAAKD
jgi:NAD-dependent deacetylase